MRESITDSGNIMYEIIKGYQKDNNLRNSFNTLALETFGLNFEDWYQNGFWGENYIPYSIVSDGRVVANVSVNLTNMMFEGKEKRFIQLGTVMTAKEYRNQGSIRQIMGEIEADYKDKIDGMYLFANDSVLDFYPKFGFEKYVEYQYAVNVENTTECQLKKVVMDNPDAWRTLLNTMNNNIFQGKFDMVGNHELIMFYVTKFMQEDVWYHRESDTYVIAEIEDEQAVIHNIFSSTLDDLDEVIALFGKEVKRIILGFTPLNSEKYEVKELKDDDTTFFIKGEAFEAIKAEYLRIPSLSHA